MKTFTFYLEKGRRVVLTGSGDETAVAKQNGLGLDFIVGVRPGDDHAYRWDEERKTWEYMYVDFA